MDANVAEVTINGVAYVQKGSGVEKPTREGMEYVLVRSARAGVFVGWAEKDSTAGTMILFDARRVWYWDGAASLSQLAMEGVSRPQNCKFPCAVDKVVLLEVVEVLYPTAQAMKSIDKVPIWTS